MKKPAHHIFVCGSYRAGGEPRGICHQKQSLGLIQYLQEELSDRGAGRFHSGSFRLDRRVAEMVCLGYAVLHLGGEVAPGDDMAGAEARWMTLAEIIRRRDVEVPSNPELFRRARSLVKPLRTRSG